MIENVEIEGFKEFANWEKTSNIFYILSIVILFFLFQLLLTKRIKQSNLYIIHTYIFFLLGKQTSNQQANHLIGSLMSKRIVNRILIVTHEMTWQPSFACLYTSCLSHSSITYSLSLKICSHAKLSSPFIDHDLIFNLSSITSFYGWKFHGNFLISPMKI